MITPRAIHLFCLPHAGTGASVYRAWVGRLAPHIAVVPITLPGRESRLNEPPFTRMGPLVEWVADRVINAGVDAPFALFGHSLGALAAFEVVRELRRRRAPEPAHLFVSGRQAPHLPHQRAPIHQLPEADFLCEIARFGGTPRAVLAEPALMAILSPALRADFEAVETYTCAPEPPIDVPITVFGGRADEPSPEDLAAWRLQTTARCDVRLVAGDHFFVVGQRDAVIREVESDLRKTTRLYNSSVLESAS